MPKQRTKKPKKVVRRTKRRGGSISIYLVIGFFLALVIWLIVKEPAVINKSITTSDNINGGTEQQNTKDKKHKKKASRSKQTDKANKRKEQSQTASKAPSSKKDNAVVVNYISTDEAIQKAIVKLGIPQGLYKRKIISGVVTYTIPINRTEMDLTYANMIFKGELERNGASFVKGTDSSGKQSLTFSSKQSNEKYVLNLYYDSKLYSGKQNPKTIAIVVDDFGSISGDLLDGFLTLDKAVTFAIFPDEPHSVDTMRRATEQGRETIIHVPMEPIGYPKVNPGKNAVFVQYSDDQIDRLISRFIKQLPDCIGINNHMGSLATTDEGVMKAVMSTLKKNDKLFLDSRTSNVSVAYPIAQKAHIRSYRNDMFLDSPNISQSTMDTKLSEIISLSASKSNIIAITHCHSQDKLQYLRKIIAHLKGAGFTLVPLSQIGQYKVPGLL